MRSLPILTLAIVGTSCASGFGDPPPPPSTESDAGANDAGVCEPRTYTVSPDRLERFVSGSCDSLEAGWHRTNRDDVYWTFGTSCSIPASDDPPWSYEFEVVSWEVELSPGRYRVSVHIPTNDDACGFPPTKYATDVCYRLTWSGGTHDVRVDQRSSVGSTVPLVDEIAAVWETVRIFLYDRTDDLVDCCDTCGQSVRVFADTITVQRLCP